MHKVLERALEHASNGIDIFPADPLSKRPYQGFMGWQHQATTDPLTINDWWQQWPDALIAAPTGRSFWVLDIDIADGRTGLQSLALLEAQYGELPETLVVRTPTKGLHFYFSTASGSEVKTSAGLVGPNIDVRGQGGYIILPGSVRPQGEYEIITNWRVK